MIDIIIFMPFSRNVKDYTCTECTIAFDYSPRALFKMESCDLLVIQMSKSDYMNKTKFLAFTTSLFIQASRIKRPTNNIHNVVRTQLTVRIAKENVSNASLHVPGIHSAEISLWDMGSTVYPKVV